MNLFTHLSGPDALALLAGLALKGSLIFLLALLATAVLRRVSAATRHAVWVVAMGAAFLLPALFVALPGWQVPVLPSAPSAPDMPRLAPLPPAAPASPAAPMAPRAVPAPPAPPSAERFVVRRGERSVVIEHRRQHAVAPPAPSLDIGEPTVGGPTVFAPFGAAPTRPALGWGDWLVVIWLAGVALVTLRWVIAVLAAWRLVQQAEPIYDLEWLELKERVAFGLDLDRPVRLLRSEHVSVPVAGGVFDPVVVLPADSDTWTEDRREVVLTHELAHIVRHDCVTQLLAQGALAIHWFNPLAWLGFRRFMLEREHACDDFVLNNGARASDYAQHLVQIARRFRTPSLGLAATAPMARRSDLEGRILSILDPEQNREGARPQRLAAVGLLGLALVAALAALEPVAADAELEPVKLTASVLPAPAPSPSASPTWHASDEDFTWEGRVRAGGIVEVYNINGSIRARTGSGDRVRVEAEKESDRGREDEVRIVVYEDARGVVACAVYPGQRERCEPGEGPSGNVRDNDVTVTFDLVLPENVRFTGRTVNGSIKTDELGGDVDVRTVNGSIETSSRRGNVKAHTVNGSIGADAGGLVDANTTNGSIKARLGRADWDGRMAFETTNGSIVLELPGDADLDVHAEAGTGSIKSDFPLPIRRDGYTGASAKGQIGEGGRLLHLQVLNGSIKLKRRGGAMGVDFHLDVDYDVDHDVDYDVERNVEREVERQRAIVREQMAYARREHDRARAEVDAVEQALAEIGPVMQVAMEEAGRALAEIDFDAEIEQAFASIDWDEVEGGMEAALAEAVAEMEVAFAESGEVRAEIRHELRDALHEIRHDLNEVRGDLREVERESGRAPARERAALKNERDRLDAVKSALEKAEREIERVLDDLDS